MRKAISEVVVVVTILMISTSLVGLIYAFMTGLQGENASDLEQASANSLKTMGSCLKVISFDDKTNSLWIKNCGRYAAENVTVFLNNSPVFSGQLNANPNEIKCVALAAPLGLYEIKAVGDYASAAGSVNLIRAAPDFGFSLSASPSSGSATQGGSTSAVWFDPAWGYRKPITISNGGGALEKYQVPVSNPVYDETGLVGSWHFDEGVGSTTADSSGNGNRGTISGPAWTFGINGSAALQFNGVNHYVYGDKVVNIPKTTVEAWVYITADPTGNKLVAGFANGLLSTKEDKMLYLTSSRNVKFTVYDGADRTATSIATVPLNAWTHVAGTADGLNAKVYVNGVQSGLSVPAGNTEMDYTVPNIFIGGASAGASYFSGRIDEVRIYNRALSPQEILSHSIAKAKLNYADLRFTDSDRISPLNFWKEADGRFWVNVTNVPAGSKKIYMYYGNPLATSKSSGVKTFEFFDDFFSGLGFDATKWVKTGANTIIETGEAKMSGSGDWTANGLVSVPAMTLPFILEYSNRFSDTGATAYQGMGNGLGSANPGAFIYENGIAAAGRIDAERDGTAAAVNIESFGTSPAKIKIKYKNPGFEIYKNDALLFSEAIWATATDRKLVFDIYQATAWFDNIRVRKYASPEPSATVGAEESYSSGDIMVTATLVPGTTAQSVSLSCLGLPAGASCSFAPPSITPTSYSDLTIFASPTTSTGTWPITISGASRCGTIESTSYILTVDPACSDGTQNGECSDTQPKYCDAGTLVNRCSACGCSSGSCQPDGSCVSLVFVSSQQYNGALGGLSGADAKCQQLADAPGSLVQGKTFKSWLSGPGNAKDRLAHSTGSYKLVDGTVIANKWEDLVDGNIQNKIDKTETGAANSGKNIWTGTNSNGVKTDVTCTDWTTSSNAINARFGQNDYADSRWTEVSGVSASCGNIYYLYCFEDSATPPPAFDFFLSASPSSGTVTQGSPATTSVTATLVSGTAQSVTFSCSAPPGINGITCSSLSLTPTDSGGLTVSTTAATQAGTHTITISGTGGGVTEITTYELTVNPAATEKIVFVSSATYNGNLGGLSGADAKCQALANAVPSLSGKTFKAWLSDSATNAKDRLAHSTWPYKLVDGTVISDDWTDLTTINVDGINYLQSPINKYEDGGAAATNEVWTNTQTNGVLTSNLASFTNCNNWADGTSSKFGYIGKTVKTSSWTLTLGFYSCNIPKRLYCFEQ